MNNRLAFLLLAITGVVASTSSPDTDADVHDYLCFETRDELDQALHDYLHSSNDNDADSRREVELLYGPIRTWCTGRITDFSHLFAYAADFDQDISGWDLSAATTIEGMFFRATSFNQPLDGWNVSNVRDMHGAFGFATAFDRDLSAWDTERVASTQSMFLGAARFSHCHSLTAWDTRSLEDTGNMLRGTPCANDRDDTREELLLLLGSEAFHGTSQQL